MTLVLNCSAAVTGCKGHWLLSKVSRSSCWQGGVQWRPHIGQRGRPNFLQPHTLRFWGIVLILRRFGLRMILRLRGRPCKLLNNIPEIILAYVVNLRLRLRLLLLLSTPIHAAVVVVAIIGLV